jgi:serine/threonine protein kinase
MEASRVPISAAEKHLGKYRLVAQLGRGGMASAHLAVMRGPAGFNKLVVLKQIHPQYAEDPEVLGMFLDEARLSARLSHPNVVQTNEVGQDGDRHFMAMEYLEGQPLNRILTRLHAAGGLPLPMYLQVIVDLLGGLHHAHELADYDGSPLGVVHRDVNPQNVIVTYEGVVKVMDFGVAKARGAVVQTQFGVVKGKISYMAPEQVRGERVDRRADVFAVGVMLWEAVTGKRPWQGMAEADVMKHLAHGEFPALLAAAADVPERLEQIILKALAPDREDRYATAADLQAELEAYLDTTGPRVHLRELSKLVCTHFAKDRAAIRSRIEVQLRAEDGPGPLVDLDATNLDMGGQAAKKGASRGSDPGGLDPMTPGPSVFTTSVPGSLSVGAGRPRSIFHRLAAGALGVAVMCAAIGLSLDHGRAAPPAAPAQAAAETALTGAPRVSSTVQARLVATPVDAQIFLDDEPLVGNPVESALPRDQATHRLRVEAPGFVTVTQSVSLDKDLSVTIALAAEPSVAATPEARRAGRGPLGKHRLDTRNPYAGR